MCEKSMPKHILVKHIAKSHPFGDIKEVREEPKFVNKYETINKKRDWDWGEIRTCAQCHSEWPDKLMSFHLKLEH